jgi:molecular chaperone GrpE
VSESDRSVDRSWADQPEDEVAPAHGPTDGGPDRPPGADGPPSDPVPESDDAATDDAAVIEAVEVAEAIARERDEYLDLARRVQADFENYKRRVDAQRDEQRERAAEDLARELLPVLDAGEAASAQGLEDAAQLHHQLLSTLEKRGLSSVSGTGVDFDPNVHEAVIHEDGDESPAVVVEVLRTGYLWNERVLRPAMVKVRG